jgi:hypothetical protein
MEDRLVEVTDRMIEICNLVAMDGIMDRLWKLRVGW